MLASAAATTLILAVLGRGLGFAWYEAVRAEIVPVADAHQRHDTAHPGWSFPARLWSAPAPLDLPRERLVAQARARGYVEVCPPVSPGQVCPVDGAILPRGGRFPEGDQPPGTDGWTRPLALEPVQIGLLVGPDAEIREHLPLARAPAHLVAAILVAEDEDFRQHAGVDLRGMARALLSNARQGSYGQGGSTLTMQVARNLSQRREKTVARKARELAQAVAIDAHLGKDGVLQMYLDAPYLGQSGSFSICGFQAAARHYWGVDASALSLAQAATLAAILPAPGRFAPDRHPDVARARRDRVLRRMGELGWDVAAALEAPVDAGAHPLPADLHPAYLQAARAALLQALPADVVHGAGLEVHTALDLVAQARGEVVLVEKIAFLERSVGRRGDQPLLAAATLVDPATGALVSVVDTGLSASTDFSRGTQARRQPGSSFKPVIYAMALDRRAEDGAPRFTAASSVPNSRRVFANTGGWMPRNVAGRYSERACLAHAITSSHNIATAALLEQAGGPAELITFATKLGFDTGAWPPEMGLALGQGEVTPLEMARMVATVANGGRLTAGSPLVLVRDAAGVVRIAPPELGPQVLSPEAAALTRELMALVVNWGTGGGIRGVAGVPGFTSAAIGKTGTTDDERDLWFVGASAHLAGALWLGYDQPGRIGASASDFASPLWGWWMREVHEGLPDHPLTGGPALTKRAVCTQSGLIPTEGCASIPAPFLPGTEPQRACDGTHEPETGVGMSEYVGLWKRLDQERIAAEDGVEAQPPSDEGPQGADSTP